MIMRMRMRMMVMMMMMVRMMMMMVMLMIIIMVMILIYILLLLFFDNDYGYSFVNHVLGIVYWIYSWWIVHSKSIFWRKNNSRFYIEHVGFSIGHVTILTVFRTMFSISQPGFSNLSLRRNFLFEQFAFFFVFCPGWWFGTWMDYDFPIILGKIFPTDELHHFSEGFKPPTSVLPNILRIVTNWESLWKPTNCPIGLWHCLYKSRVIPKYMWHNMVLSLILTAVHITITNTVSITTIHNIYI